MRKLSLAIIFILLNYGVIAQKTMRTVEQLINTEDPGWTLVQDWIKEAKNKVEVLPCDTVKAKEALYKTQVTTRSPMGAIVYSSGGLLIDNGWIRILGSGHSRLQRTLPDWNKGKTSSEFPSFFLIADDAVGGFYALNYGALGNNAGKVYYLSPDNLKWEALDLTYTEFLLFCFNHDLDTFYKGLRWMNWKDEVLQLDGDKVFNFYPFLWTKEGKDISKNFRKSVPIEEQYSLNMDMRKQLGDD